MAYGSRTGFVMLARPACRSCKAKLETALTTPWERRLRVHEEVVAHGDDPPMTGNWDSSNRRQRLPANWPAIRSKVLKRDLYRCQWSEHGLICGQPANQVDHVINGDDHRMINLRSLCEPHHALKSSAEGNHARWHSNPRRRPEEPHPGTIP